MFELLIAASALSLVIMIFRKTQRIIDQKKPVDWGMAGHESPKVAKAKKMKGVKAEPDVAPKEEGTPNNALDFYSINKYFRQAETAFARGDFADAEKLYIKVLSYQDDHPETLNKLGIIYIQQDDLRKAELMFNKLMTTLTKDPSHFCNYGRCLYGMGRKEEAIAAYEKGIEMDSTKPNRYMSTGHIYYELGNYPKALERFQEALAIDPYNFEYLTTVADVSEMVKDTELLYKTLKKMLEIDPYNFEVKRRFDAIQRG